MIKFLGLALLLVLMGSGAAVAHQPVLLLDSDTTAVKGPLLVDGTISFALRASFTKVGQKKAFRAAFKEGDALAVQYLVVDRKPESTLATSALPTLDITGPGGFKVMINFNERTKFYEPFSGVNYLFLGRYSGVVKAGVYSFVISSKGKAAITVAVGEKEITGEVVRGTTPTT